MTPRIEAELREAAAQILSLATRLTKQGLPAGDLGIARMAAAGICRDDGWDDLAKAYLKGSFDDDDEVRIALAALRIARAMEGAKQ